MRHLLFAFFLLVASPCAVAVPLRFQLDMVAGSIPRGHFLVDATMHLDITWDAAAVSPSFVGDDITLWPVGDSTGSLTIIGSATADGTYAAEFSNQEAFGWQVANNVWWGGDVLYFPSMFFEINGKEISTGRPSATFAGSFFSGSPPFFPKPFTNSDAGWGSIQIDLVNATVLYGAATYIPEPGTAGLAIAAFVCLAALRHRK